MTQTTRQTAPILSALPREIRDQIWYLCIASESEELCDGKRRMSFCLGDCKEARSFFPYEFFGPLCSSLGLGPAEYFTLRRMNLIFICKQIFAEAAQLYRRILTFSFKSTQCLEVFSAVLGRTRSQACIMRLEVVEEIRPCLRGNDTKLSIWRASIKDRVETLGNEYYQSTTGKDEWTTTTGQVAEDAYTDRYWFRLRLEKTS